MTAYEEGFIKTCAALGVDPARLVKAAAPQLPSTGGKMAPRTAGTSRTLTAMPKLPSPQATFAKTMKPQAVPGEPRQPAAISPGVALSPTGTVGTATSAQVPAAKNGPRQITWAEVQRGVRNAPRDPESQPLTFEPQNFWRNVRSGFRKVFGR